MLKGVDFDAQHGDVTMVMGPSGSGKSTLIAALSGLLRPDEGEVKALGQDLWSRRPGRIDRFRLDHCGFIFQGFNLFPALTALEQVTTVLRYKGLSRKRSPPDRHRGADEVGLEPRMHQRPSELSGGEKQRVAIARAARQAPGLLFADEPTSALDGESGQMVIRLLRRAATEHGAAVICVTHDPRLEGLRRPDHPHRGRPHPEPDDPGDSPTRRRVLDAAVTARRMTAMPAFLRRPTFWLTLLGVLAAIGAGLLILGGARTRATAAAPAPAPNANALRRRRRGQGRRRGRHHPGRRPHRRHRPRSRRQGGRHGDQGRGAGPPGGRCAAAGRGDGRGRPRPGPGPDRRRPRCSCCGASASTTG